MSLPSACARICMQLLVGERLNFLIKVDIRMANDLPGASVRFIVQMLEVKKQHG